MKKTIIYTIALIGLCSFTLNDTIIDMRTINRIDGIPELWNHNDYVKDVHNDLDKFTGEWIFDNGVEKIELTVYKELHVPNIISLDIPGLTSDQIYSDRLAITYKFYLNGILTLDGHTDFQNEAAVFRLKNLRPHLNSNGAGASNSIDNGYSIVEGIYQEISSIHPCKTGQNAIIQFGYQTIINNVNGQSTTGRIHWKRNNIDHSTESVMYDGTACDNSDYIIPSEMVLIKQP